LTPVRCYVKLAALQVTINFSFRLG